MKEWEVKFSRLVFIHHSVKNVLEALKYSSDKFHIEKEYFSRYINKIYSELYS